MAAPRQRRSPGRFRDRRAGPRAVSGDSPNAPGQEAGVCPPEPGDVRRDPAAILPPVECGHRGVRSGHLAGRSGGQAQGPAPGTRPDFHRAVQGQLRKEGDHVEHAAGRSGPDIPVAIPGQKDRGRPVQEAAMSDAHRPSGPTAGAREARTAANSPGPAAAPAAWSRSSS